MSLSDYYTDGESIYDLYRMFYYTHNLLVKWGVSYYASCGTLLGAVRHGGIIPWDNDIDLAISSRDAERIDNPEFRRELKSRGYRLKYFKADRRSRGKYDWLKILGKNYDGIDLFITETVEIKRGVWVNRLRGAGNKMYPQDYNHISDIYPLKYARFGSGVIPIPNRPQSVLKRMYGSDYKRKGYITKDPYTFEELGYRIPVKTGEFVPARPFYRGKRQTKLHVSHPLMSGVCVGFLPT